MVNNPPGTVAALINAELADSGRSVRWLSETTGIPYTTLTRKLRGLSDIGSNEMVIIATRLEVHPSAITPDIFKSVAS